MEEIKIIEDALKGPLMEKGYELISAKISNSKDGITLSLVVDKDDPISLEDIVDVSNTINPILDALDPIKSAYTLDVSSLGAEKPIRLENLGKCQGKYVNIHLSHPYKGENILEGTIEEIDDEALTLAFFVKGRPVKAKLLRKDVDKARLAIKF